MKKDQPIIEIEPGVWAQKSTVSMYKDGPSIEFNLEIDFNDANMDDLYRWAYANRKISCAGSLRNLTEKEFKALSGGSFRISAAEIATGKKGKVIMTPEKVMDKMNDEQLKQLAAMLKAKGLI